MKMLLALLGNLVGLSLIGTGLWLFHQQLPEKASFTSYWGLVLVLIAIPIYGVGAEMIGEMRADAVHKAKHDKESD